MRAAALVVAAATLVAAPATAATIGGLRQLAPPRGCVGAPAACTAVDMNGPVAVVVSPDGKRLYAATFDANRILIFDRNTTTGVLTPRPGTSGCIAQGGDNVTCAPARALNGPWSLAMSPSGSHLYVGSSAAIATLNVAPDGRLSQPAGADGCANGNGAESCYFVPGLAGVRGIAVAPDGDNLYAAASTSDLIAIFDIALDGSLSQGAAPSGCIDEDGGTGTNCVDGQGLEGVTSVAVPTNGLVVAGSSEDHAVTAMLRDANGHLAHASCVAVDGDDGGCGTAAGLSGVSAVAATGSRVYAAAAAADRLVSFGLTSGGALSLLGCVAHGGADGCRTARALDHPQSLALSPDRRQLYAVSLIGDSVTAYDAVATGLAPRSGGRNCIVAGDTPPTGCAGGSGLDAPYGVAVAPDGRSVYTAAHVSDAIGVFRRDSSRPTCSSLTRKVNKGWRAQISLRCTDADGDSLTYRVVKAPAHGTTTNLEPSTGAVRYTPDARFYGADSFTYAATANGVSSKVATVTVDVVACKGYETRSGAHWIGTAGKDVLLGTKGRDVICGLGDADRLEGRGGVDLLLGGGGADELLGQLGDDVLDGQKGSDSCLGGPGTDTFRSCEED